jgi:hypothetical protein
MNDPTMIRKVQPIATFAAKFSRSRTPHKCDIVVQTFQVPQSFQVDSKGRRSAKTAKDTVNISSHNGFVCHEKVSIQRNQSGIMSEESTQHYNQQHQNVQLATYPTTMEYRRSHSLHSQLTPIVQH